MRIDKLEFGKVQGESVMLYLLENDNGMKVRITNYGGIITSIEVPDRNGSIDDVVLGFDKLQGYLDGHPYFGAIIGRFGNRIAKGKFTLDGETYTLAANNGDNHLHGGVEGFDKKIWKVKEVDAREGRVGLELSYTSVDMEEGYPGELEVGVSYFLTNDNELVIQYRAVTDRATPVNLTNHSYFNLGGCSRDVLDHKIKIDAGSYVEVDGEAIPTGEIPTVEGTAFDFREYHTIGERIEQTDGGYDHSFIFDDEGKGLKKVVEVQEPVSGRSMEVFTTEPAAQFYAGNFLDGIKGKGGIEYNRRYGFCIETQHNPDSPNRPEFPSCILRPGETYSQDTIYKFSVR